jgi:hypothetical protein
MLNGWRLSVIKREENWRLSEKEWFLQILQKSEEGSRDIY